MQCVIGKSSQVDTKNRTSLMTFFTITQEFILWLRHYLAPLIDLLSHFVPSLQKRKIFEELNHFARSSESFKKRQVVADLCFEVSSEGEWEQVAVLANEEISRGKCVEIIYSSPSLEKKMGLLFEQFPQQVRCLRLPFLNPTTLFDWVTASTLILCRYDFFPELLALKWQKQMRLILMSATLKGKNLERFYTRYYLRSLYRQFDLIYTSTEKDCQLFLQLGLDSTKVKKFELRDRQIIHRQESSTETFKLKGLMSFASFLNSYPRERRIVLGSCWPNEMDIFRNERLQQQILSSEVLVVLSPHKLGQDFLLEMIKNLRRAAPQIPIQRIDSKTESFDKGSILISEIPGVLCETYSLFGSSYVGGGFGRSIHSVSEPFWSGCRIVVGPKTHRSTEYDFVYENCREDISVVSQLSEVSQRLLQDDSDYLAQRLRKRDELKRRAIEQSMQIMAHLRHCLEDIC